MRNESSITMEEFKKQIIRQIENSSPGVTVSPEHILIKVKLEEDSEPVPFHSLKVVINT